MLLEIFLCIITTLLFAYFFWMRKLYLLYKERNIKQLELIPSFKHAFQTFTGKKHIADVVDDKYKLFPNEDLFVHFEAVGPQLVLKNPSIIEDVLIRDFASFHDRMKVDGEIRSPEDANLFMLKGNVWRAVRSKFSPLFTSGKLKFMYQSMTDCGKNLEQVLDKKDNQEVDMTDTMGLFAMDVIGSTAFGIESNLLQNPNSEFREMGLKVFENSAFRLVKFVLLIMFPRFSKALGIRGFFEQRVVKYFCTILKESIDHRKKGGFHRNDFVQMLLQLKEKGKIEMQTQDPGDDYLLMNKGPEVFELELTDDILIGGAFSFLTAGFHATAMTLAYALFHLAQAPGVVGKLRAEIREHVKGEGPTYEELKGMHYTEQVLKEAMRMHPAAPGLSRVCNKEYSLPNGVTIMPGEALYIPVQSIHMDPALWADPETFNPDRFADTPAPGSYLPFGEGPRICIAMRFAMMEMKFALVKLVKNYNFELSEKTKLPLKLKPRAFVSTPEGGIHFLIRKI